MSNVFVERQDDGSYAAIQDKKVIARGDTQAETIDRAQAKRPDDTVLAERVRMTTGGSRDKWRKV